jgi:hypothetical protein
MYIYVYVAPLTFFFNSVYEIIMSTFVSTTVELHLSRRISNYPGRLGPLVKFVENSTKLTLKLPVIGSSTVQCYGF